MAEDIKLKKVKPKSKPSERRLCAMCIAGDITSDSYSVYIFGGSSKGSKYLDDMWCMDIDSDMNTDELNWKIVSKSRYNWPRKKSCASLDYYNDKLYLIGGYNKLGTLNDIWSYNIQKRTWHVSNTTLKIDSHATVVYKEFIIIFGGDIGGEKSNDIYIFDTKEACVKNIKCTNKPSKRQSHAMCIYNDFIVMSGGRGNVKHTYFNDIYAIKLYDVVNDNNPQWIRLNIFNGFIHRHNLLSNNKQFYIINGYDKINTALHTNIVICDNIFDKNTVKTVDITEASRCAGAACIVCINNISYILTFGGIDDNHIYSNDTYLIRINTTQDSNDDNKQDDNDMKHVKKEVILLKKDSEKIENKLLIIEEQNKELKNDISILKKENELIKQDTKETKDQNKILTKEVNMLKNKLSEIEKVLKNIKKQLKNSDNEIYTFLNNINMDMHFDKFISEGFETLDDINNITNQELIDDIGVNKLAHRKKILTHLRKYKDSYNNDANNKATVMGQEYGEQILF